MEYFVHVSVVNFEVSWSGLWWIWEPFPGPLRRGWEYLLSMKTICLLLQKGQQERRHDTLHKQSTV